MAVKPVRPTKVTIFEAIDYLGLLVLYRALWEGIPTQEQASLVGAAAELEKSSGVKVSAL